jgi:hypothetical protein
MNSKLTLTAFVLLTLSCAGAELAPTDPAPDDTSEIRYEVFGMD